MRKLIILLALVVVFFGTNALAFFLRFDSVKTYTDNTAIEPQFAVTYDAWVDGNILALGFPTVATGQVKIPLIDNTFGASHSYKVRTKLSDGRVSDNVVATLTSPLDSRLPKAPAAPLSVGQ
jgi:hypothetical protein